MLPHLVGVDLLALRRVHALALQELAAHDAAVPDGWLEDEQGVVHHEVAQHKAAPCNRLGGTQKPRATAAASRVCCIFYKVLHTQRSPDAGLGLAQQQRAVQEMLV